MATFSSEGGKFEQHPLPVVDIYIPVCYKIAVPMLCVEWSCVNLTELTATVIFWWQFWHHSSLGDPVARPCLK